MSCSSCCFFRAAKQDFFKSWCEKTGDLVFSKGDDCCEYQRSPIVLDLDSKRESQFSIFRAKRDFLSSPKPSGFSGLSRDQVHSVFVEWAKQDPLTAKSFDDLLEKKRWAKT